MKLCASYQVQCWQTVFCFEFRFFANTNQLVKQGINKVIQKVGEEAVELVIEAKDDNEDLFKNEAADLLYHFLILLKVKNIKLENVEQILSLRSKKSRG